MGQAIDYCASCGDRVSSQDIEKGKAIAVAEKVYCPNCRSKAPQVAPAGTNGKTRRTGSTGAFPAIKAPIGGGTQRLPGGHTGTHRSVGSSSQRLPSIQEPPPPAAAGKLPLIAGGGALVLLLGAAILFFMQSAKEKEARAAEEKRLSAAKEAFEEFVKYGKERPEDPDGQLRMYDEAAKKTKGTEWAGKLRAEKDDAENRKKALAIRKERSDKMNGLRGRMLTGKAVADLDGLAGDVKKFQEEMAAAGDQDFMNQAGALRREIGAKRIQVAVDDAKNFEALNAEKYDECVARWTEAKMACGEDARQLEFINGRIQEIKVKKEDAAKKDWEQVRVKVENARKEKKYDAAIDLIRGFRDTHAGSAVLDEATKLAWDIDADRARDAEAARNKPPGDPKPTDPGLAAPKDWTTLYDDKTPGKWVRNGVDQGKWEVSGGVLVGTNSMSEADAIKDTANRGWSLYYFDKTYANYELEIDFTLVKGEVTFVAGLATGRNNPPAIPFKPDAKEEEVAVLIARDKSYTLTCKVTTEAISFKGNGVPERGWRIDGSTAKDDRTAGVFGFALRPQSEVRIRSVRIRAVQ